MFKNILPTGLKTSFGIAKTSTYFDELILNAGCVQLFRYCQFKVKEKTDRGHFLDVIGSLVSEIDENGDIQKWFYYLQQMNQ